MALEGNSFIAKYGMRTISYVVGFGLALVLILIAVSTSATTVKNTDVGIVFNNITGNHTIYENGGMVMHLPFWLSTVYSIDKSQRNLHMTRAVKTEEHPSGEHVMIKTNDGSNVEADVEIVYQIDVRNAYIAYRELMDVPDTGRIYGSSGQGTDQNMESILRAVTRSEIRNQLGNLSTLEISEPQYRNEKLHLVLQKLAEYFKPMGVEILSVNAQNFHFNEEYERIVRERKSADQILVNQKDFQSAKTETGNRLVAEATKTQKTQLAQLDGLLKKNLVTAHGEERRILAKATQEAYQLEVEGEIAVRTAEQEAVAIKTEGEQKAQALGILFDAYEKGGEGLVRESLIKLYEGVNLSAKPYSPSDRLDRIQAVPMPVESAPAQPPVRNTQQKGGANAK